MDELGFMTLPERVGVRLLALIDAVSSVVRAGPVRVLRNVLKQWVPGFEESASPKISNAAR